ncbi:E3 ubiquitin-protein ligase [Hordeum vulgare]|nr:E3 ubiquitin-protein ligase [Hordeum vulgare]
MPPRRHLHGYTHCRYIDGLVDNYKVPCLNKKHGCERSVAYHSVAEHRFTWAHTPCYCSECTPPFEGSPAELLRHFTAPAGKHSSLTDKIKYESSQSFVVQASEEEYRCLLIAEDGFVFLLTMGAGGGSAGRRRPVNVVYVRDADVHTRPLYTGVLWVDGPPTAAGDVASCSVPGEVDMEHGWLHAHVNPSMLQRESGEVHVRLRITKFP